MTHISGPDQGSVFYVVANQPIDMAKVKCPPYLSWECPAIGYRRVVKFHCSGASVEDGLAAIRAVYPEALGTYHSVEAGHLAAEFPTR